LFKSVCGAEIDNSPNLTTLNADTQTAELVRVKFNVAATIEDATILHDATFLAIGQA
jgi:hypothetical protein